MAMASDTVPGMEGEATLIDEQQVSLATPAALTAVSQVEESVEYFTSTSRVEKCELTTKHLENLELVADNGGWSAGRIEQLLGCARRAAWPAQLLRRLLCCLVPRDAVAAPQLAALATWALGDPRLSRDCVVLPTLRLISLSLQYDCLTERASLSGLYELFLAVLPREKLTPVVAELLGLLTTKAEVTGWRVERVRALRGAMGALPALDLLLAKYRSLRSDLVPQHAAPPPRTTRQGATALHKRFHRVWENRVTSRLEASGIWMAGVSAQSNARSSKAARECLVPGGAPLALARGLEARGDKRLALSEATSLAQVTGQHWSIAPTIDHLSTPFLQVTDNLHRLHLPAQILSLLGCRVGVNLLLTDPAVVERFSLTLYHTLHNDFLCGGQEGSAALQARRHKRQVQELLEPCKYFLLEAKASLWSTPVSQLVSQSVSLSHLDLRRWLGHRGAFASPSTPSDGLVMVDRIYVHLTTRRTCCGCWRSCRPLCSRASPSSGASSPSTSPSGTAASTSPPCSPSSPRCSASPSPP